MQQGFAWRFPLEAARSDERGRTDSTTLREYRLPRRPRSTSSQNLHVHQGRNGQPDPTSATMPAITPEATPTMASTKLYAIAPKTSRRAIRVHCSRDRSARASPASRLRSGHRCQERRPIEADLVAALPAIRPESIVAPVGRRERLNIVQEVSDRYQGASGPQLLVIPQITGNAHQKTPGNSSSTSSSSGVFEGGGTKNKV